MQQTIANIQILFKLHNNLKEDGRSQAISK